MVTNDGTPREWNKIREIKDPSARSVEVQLKKGNGYEFLVTATNEFGEALKEDDKVKKTVVLGGMCVSDSAQNILLTLKPSTSEALGGYLGFNIAVCQLSTTSCSNPCLGIYGDYQINLY